MIARIWRGWTTAENADAFQGDDYGLAHVPAVARALLAGYDERTAHYDLLLNPDESLR